jgi:CRP/FNR family transcriptional regulator, anaerobic regulatory protein
MEYSSMSALTAPGFPARCSNCAVRHTSVCGLADDESQKELNRISHVRTYTAGETIIAEDEKSFMVGNVVSGVLRMSKTMLDGRQQIVGLLFPSEMFGRVFSDRSSFAVEAATDVTLCCFERNAFERLLAKKPVLEHQMLLMTLDELDAARDWMLLLGAQTVLERLVSFMLILIRRSQRQKSPGASDGEAFTLTIPISRKDLATYIGTTVETISRKVQHLSRKRTIRIIDPRHFEILNYGQLVRMSGREDIALELALGGVGPARDEPGHVIQFPDRAAKRPHPSDALLVHG